MDNTLASFTDVLDEEICDSQPISLTLSNEDNGAVNSVSIHNARPVKGTGQQGNFRSTEEIDPKYRDVFTYPYFNLVQSNVIEDALYSDKSIVVCAPTGSGKTVIFEMAIVQLLMELEDKHYTEDFKIIYMAPVKALCTERLTEWYPKFTKLGLMCIEATGDTDVDFTQLKPYKIIITTPEKWDMLTRRWRDHRGLVEVIKLFLIDEVHILNDEVRGPVLEAVVSRMKTIESSAQSAHRIETLQNQLHGTEITHKTAPSIRFVAVSATVSNPEDVANWLGTATKPAVFHKFGDECRPVKLKRIVEGYPCPEGSSIFKFDIILNYKLWPVIQKYHSGKPTLIFCNTRKSVILTAETLSRELTINFSAEQKAKLTALASTIKNKKLQSLAMCGVGCHHAGLLYEERLNVELAFRNRDLPILITTTTLAMGVNLPAHLVIIKNTQQYVNGAYQEYSISTILQMVGRAGRPQFDTEATAVIMTRLADKARYQALVGGCEPLQSYLHRRLPENLNSEAALGTVGDVAQCVQWLRSTFLYVRALKDPKKYLNLPQNSPQHLISKKIEELCVRAMNGLATAGLITMDEASCIQSTEAGRLMSIFYLDLETMKLLMKMEGTETLERLLALVCESHELADMHLRVDERRCLNALNRNNAAATIRFPMKGKITTRQMKVNCIIQAVLGCLAIPDPSLNQEAMKIMRIADRVCKCLVAFVTRPDLVASQPQFYSTVLNSIVLAKCIAAHLWENSPYVSRQLKGIGPTFSTLLATAGKVNFMLLEESHPRDLERIMNKGPPAGNVLRKQVSLLPKYQLSMTPVDENTVTLQLVLLNKNYLAEHIEEMTARSTHKCYIVVGDSDNNLLLLASFKDMDLLSVFDGTITHEIRRKSSCEHKILAHCISTTFVGIDDHTEYVFNDLNQFVGETCKYPENETLAQNSVKRQTCITDTFNQRKRKSTLHLSKAESKEKKKRDNAIIENFNYLKKTFETASKNVKENLNLSNNTYKLTDYSVNIIPERDTPKEDNIDKKLHKIPNDIIEVNETDSDDYINDEKIDSILTEIENEMCRNKVNSRNTKRSNTQKTDVARITPLSKFWKEATNKAPVQPIIHSYKTAPDKKKRNTAAPKSNYTFIELLERNLDLSDNDETKVDTCNNNGFSETIKNQINKYILNAETKAKTPNINVNLLLEEEEKKTSNDNDIDRRAIEVNDEDIDEILTPTQKLYPHYEIVEILGNNNTNSARVNNDQTGEFEKTECTITSPEKIYEDNVLSEVDNNIKTSIHNTNTAIVPVYNIQNTPTSSTNDNIQTTTNNNKSLTDDNCRKQINQGDSDCEQQLRIFCADYVDSFINMKGKDLHTIDPSWKLNASAIPVEAPPNGLNSCTNATEYNQHTQDFTATASDQSVLEYGKENSTENSNYETEPTVTLVNSIPKTFNSNTLLNYDNRNTTSIEAANSGLKIVPNQTCIDNNHSPSFINVCEEANITVSSNNSFNQVSSKNRKTTKIEFYANETPEYCVQITKKIEVDLNITKILTTDQRRYLNIPKLDTTTQHSNKDLFHDGLDLNYNLQNSNINHLNPPTYEKQTDNKDFLEVHERESKKATQHFKRDLVNGGLDFNKNLPMLDSTINKLHQLTCESNNKDFSEVQDRESKKSNQEDNSTTSKQNVICAPYTYQNSQPKQSLDLSESKDLHYTKNTHDNKSKNENVDNESNFDNTNAEDLDYGIKTGHNKVQNILQKYSKILAKDKTKALGFGFIFLDKTKAQTSGCPVSSKSTIYNKSPKPKFTKPFKICDIQKLHTELPNSIIECNKQTVEQNFSKLQPKMVNNEEVIKKHVAHDTQPEHYTPRYCTNTLVKNDACQMENNDPYQSSLDIDLEPIQLPYEVDVDAATDVTIDQSMFDPKTLLQCSVDTDEIIPPPPEFSDNTTPPDYADFEYPIKMTNYSQFDESQLNNSDNKLNYNDNIFEDQSITHLTPSSEIETWTLAQEDSWEDDYSTPNAGKSFTVVRKNTPNIYHLSGNSTIPRQAKLGQFKFIQKNKLRKWK